MRHPFPHCLAVVSKLFLRVSHAAGSVEHNFTGSEGSHHVICSSISAAIRNRLMPYSGGPQDYTHVHQLLLTCPVNTQNKRKRAMLVLTS